MTRMTAASPCAGVEMATTAQWLEGARPRTLPAAVAPVLVGTGAAAAAGRADLSRAMLALAAAQVTLPLLQAAPIRGIVTVQCPQKVLVVVGGVRARRDGPVAVVAGSAQEEPGQRADNRDSEDEAQPGAPGQPADLRGGGAGAVDQRVDDERHCGDGRGY